jgi:hypothetical protein
MPELKPIDSKGSENSLFMTLEKWTNASPYDMPYPSSITPKSATIPTAKIESRDNIITQYFEGFPEWLITTITTTVGNMNFSAPVKDKLLSTLKKGIGKISKKELSNKYSSFHSFDTILRKRSDKVTNIFEDGGPLANIFNDILSSSDLDLGLHLLNELAKDRGLTTEKIEKDELLVDVKIIPPLTAS